MKKTTIRSVWANMKARCNNLNIRNYHNYGGRGIKVCKEWIKYSNFERDMLPKYKDGLTLDRIDNDGNYCKENCRWVTQKEQMRNTRVNHRVTYKGETKTLIQWSEIFGITYKIFWQRLKKGIPLERASVKDIRHKTHCSEGHPFSKENTEYVGRRKFRRCGICRYSKNKLWNSRNRERINAYQREWRLAQFNQM